MSRRVAAPLLIAAGLTATANAQLLHSWSAPSFDDGNPIPDFVATWLTDVDTGGEEDVTSLGAAQALAADNANGRVYASTGRSLSTFAIDESGALVRLTEGRRIFDTNGKGAEPDQIASLGFANGVLYAFAGRKLGDEARGRGIERGFYAIDPETAIATLLPSPIEGQLFSGIGFNEDDGLMYAVMSSFPAQILRFDLDTLEVEMLAQVPESAYGGNSGRLDGLAVGDGKVFLTNNARSNSLVSIPIVVYDIASGTFEDGLPMPFRSAENSFYSSGATFIAAAPPPATCAGDVNGDGLTGLFDFATLTGNFGATGLPRSAGESRSLGDLNDDGNVDLADFTLLAADFGCAPQS